MRKYKRSFLILSVLLIVGISIFSGIKYLYTGRDLPQIKRSGYLRVVFERDPWGAMPVGDSLIGFQYELAKAFADSLGLRLKVRFERTDHRRNRILALIDGKCDLVADYIPRTSGCPEKLLLSAPLALARQMLLQPSGKGKTNRQSELANDTLYLPEGSHYSMRIQHLSEELALPVHSVELEGKSAEDVAALISEGKIAYGVCNEIEARRLLRKYPKLDASLPLGFEQEYCWGLHANSVLLMEQLNSFLKDMVDSKTYWSIYKKYL